jgi:hypothetical protein
MASIGSSAAAPVAPRANGERAAGPTSGSGVNVTMPAVLGSAVPSVRRISGGVGTIRRGGGGNEPAGG